MLEILNRYGHGLASISSLSTRYESVVAWLAWRLALLQLTSWRASSPRTAAISMLPSGCWSASECLRIAADGRYKVTGKLAYLDIIPDRIMELYHFPFDSYLQGGLGASLEPWLERSERHWDSEHPYLPDYLDGLIIIPLLLSLRAQGWLGCYREHGCRRSCADLASAWRSGSSPRDRAPVRG